MKALNSNFDFFDYTPKKISNDEQKERQERIVKKDAEIKEKMEKRVKKLRYEKALSIRLG